MDIFERKIKELILAIQVDKKYSKDQILEMYLNDVSYGGSNIGVEAAAESYFGKKAKELNLVIVLKGHYTIIATPGGKVYFNSTGNAGMAKGGSGDVLTGILTALVGQYHDTVESAMLGVYLHGQGHSRRRDRAGI